jgi:hypothetical protein
MVGKETGFMIMRRSYFWTAPCMIDLLHVDEQTRRPQREILCVVYLPNPSLLFKLFKGR